MADADPFTAALVLQGAAADATSPPVAIDDLHSGVYRVRVAATRVGVYTLRVQLHGQVAPLVDTVVRVTPAAASAAASEALFDPTVRYAAVVAVPWGVRVTALDVWGNRHSTGGLGVAASAATTQQTATATEVQGRCQPDADPAAKHSYRCECSSAPRELLLGLARRDGILRADDSWACHQVSSPRPSRETTGWRCS
jgi:hypothetical protein